METEKIAVAEYFDDRVYRIPLGNGKYHDIASVSTKLGIEDKPFLLKYYAQLGWEQARRELHRAGDRGKRIHFALWVYLQGGIIIYNPWQKPSYSELQVEEFKKESNGLFFAFTEQDEMLAMHKLQKFFEITGAKIFHSEHTVFSIEDDIAGTLDMALQMEKGTYDVNGRSKLIIPQTGILIADLKTGNQIPDNVWEQIAPYAIAYEKMNNMQAIGGLVLHTSAATRTAIEGFATQFRDRISLNGSMEIYKSLAYVWNQRNPDFGPKAFTFPTMIRRKTS